MAGGINIEFLVGAIIGWYISSQFLAGPVSSIVSQVVGGIGGGGGGGKAAGRTSSKGYGG